MTAIRILERLADLVDNPDALCDLRSMFDMAAAAKKCLAEGPPPGLNKRELATVLSSLRSVQERCHIEGYHVLKDYDHFYGEEFSPLTMPEIDELCERLNQ